MDLEYQPIQYPKQNSDKIHNMFSSIPPNHLSSDDMMEQHTNQPSNSHSSLSSDDNSSDNIQMALQTLVSVRNSNKQNTPPPILSTILPSYISAFDKVSHSSHGADSIGIEIQNTTDNFSKTEIQNQLESSASFYQRHASSNIDTFKHESPLKIGIFQQNPDIVLENEKQLSEYTHTHEPVTHNTELLYSRHKSLENIHSIDIDNMRICSNSPALYSKNNSNNNSFHGGSGSDTEDINHTYHYRKEHTDYNSDCDNHSQLLYPPTSNIFSDYPVNNTSQYKSVTTSNTNQRNVVARKKYKKLTYDDVAKSLSHYYDDYNKYSNEMDILITFIRGQKHLFLQASNITSFKLYSMLFLALCITAFVTIVTPFVRSYGWNVVLITSCNACATLVISMTRYWNFEFNNNAYIFLSNNYDKLEHSLELANNKLTFLDNETEQNKIVLEKIKEVEYKIGEMKDVFQASIPQEVTQLFPVISHVNIFSFIKKMESHKRLLIYKYRDIKNEINYFMYKLKQQYNEVEMDEMALLVEKKRILYLDHIKNRIKSELVNYKEAYNQIDFLFTKEIQFAEKHVNIVYALPLYYWLYGKPKYLDIELYSNPVIREYLNLIIYDDSHMFICATKPSDTHKHSSQNGDDFSDF